MSRADRNADAVITVALPHRDNPEIGRGREHVHEWCEKYGVTGHATTLQRFADADPARIIGYAYPDARGADLDLALDMMCFFNAFDDCFESAYWASPAEGIPFVGSMASLLYTKQTCALSPIAEAFCDIWRRSISGMSPQWAARAAHNWTQCLWGYISEGTARHRGPEPGLSDYLTLRRTVIGTAPCFDMLERVHRYELRPQIWFHRDIRQLSDTATDIVILCNDIASVAKDTARGDTANAVLLLMIQGMTRQEAEQRIGNCITELAATYQTKGQAISDLCDQLRLDETARLATMRWIRDVLEWAGANLAWQEEISRYHGKAKAILPDARHMATLAGQP
jgi:hypothetical protein